MANATGIITAVVLCSAALVAVKNKGKYDQEIANRKAEQDKLVKNEALRDEARNNLTATQTTLAETKEQIVALNSQKTTVGEANEKIKATIEERTAQVEADKAKLDGIKEQLAGIESIDVLLVEVERTNSQIAELEQNIATAEAELANLSSANNRLEQVIENFRSISALYPAQKSSPSLKTRINATYPNWGFVTLGAGNSSGVVTNSTLDVVRDGETIAKLVVTAAEGSTASATIVPDSLKEDTTLMVGDSVVAAK